MVNQYNLQHQRNINKVEKKKQVYNEDQNFCVDCNRPINKRCLSSDIMQGKCGKCYRTNFKEYERRIMRKNRTRNRNSQRKHKTFTQEYL